MKKIASIALSIVLAMGLFAGCGGGASSANSTGGTANTAPAQKTDLLLWLPPFSSGDSLDKEFWTKTLQPWAEENNVNLSIEITPWGNYEEKYLTGFSSGAGPDVGYMYLEMFNDFIEMGALEPLDNYFTQEEKDNYLHFDLGNVKGHQYTVPFVVGNARVLYFNMDHLNKAGVTELPETWDELVEVLTKVKDANIEGVMPFAQEWADPAIGALNNIYYQYLWQAGGDIYDKDGKVALMENDGAVRAAQFLHDLRFKYGVLPEESLSLTEGDVRTMFAEGKIAVAQMAANRAVEMDAAGINWQFIPSLKDKQMATWVAADALIVNSASANKEKAVELIKFITSAPVMEAFHTEVSSFPPITKDAEYKDNPVFESLYADADYLHTLPVAPNSFKVMDTLYKNLQLMMLGDLTPEEAIEKTVEYSNSIA